MFLGAFALRYVNERERYLQDCEGSCLSASRISRLHTTFHRISRHFRSNGFAFSNHVHALKDARRRSETSSTRSKIPRERPDTDPRSFFREILHHARSDARTLLPHNFSLLSRSFRLCSSEFKSTREPCKHCGPVCRSPRTYALHGKRKGHTVLSTMTSRGVRT